MSNSSQASQRIAALLDDNSFVEIGAKVTARATDFNMKPTETPSDGVVTGYGVIDGSLVYVYSQDASVMNGTVGEMHAKKIANLYDLALKTGAPVIGLIDSAGLRLHEADGGFWRDSTDHSSFRYLRRWTCPDSCINGFYIYGRQKSETVCELTKRTCRQ